MPSAVLPGVRYISLARGVLFHMYQIHRNANANGSLVFFSPRVIHGDETHEQNRWHVIEEAPPSVEEHN